MQVHEKAGPGVLKLLPADLNPKLREQLTAAIAGAPAESPAARPQSQPAQASPGQSEPSQALSWTGWLAWNSWHRTSGQACQLDAKVQLMFWLHTLNRLCMACNVAGHLAAWPC